MKKVLVLGASGLLGQSIVNKLAGAAEVIGASMSDAEYPVDISNPESLQALLAKVGKVDAIICTAGVVNFVPWQQATDADWKFGISNKMMGQINLLRFGTQYVNEGGVIVVTTGILAQNPIPGSSVVSAVNAAVESVVHAASLEVEGVRFNAVSPGWVKETMEAMGMDATPGLPATEVAQVYVDLIEHSTSGEIHLAVK
ncbi:MULTISPECIES: short chain dehydrogenase [unclassified Pseudoalteromonas]|uniref:short chain dehydrogenase n=1 Tax=unclassified Pseudoalteromonas TaxID=194690 RepID=UPI0020970D1D|nr:short chain dehydrogenase [Pseudoalteromonas sp. XMcav2-N]MCO7189294.1 short chain dehydrogenase [Pseudoalteromonas sp. XMcav2-N]